MTSTARQFTRSATIHCNATNERLFPLLCPKREEEWIPGWECETLWSSTGYNEEGAIFRTTKPYGTELYWTTLRYDRGEGVVDFLISAPHLFNFRFTIQVTPAGDGMAITFIQTFTSVSEEGTRMIGNYQADDFAARMAVLGSLIERYLQA